MSSVNKWRVYCNTENDWSYGWLDENVYPNKCFNDSNHSINTNSINIIDTVNPNEMKIIQENNKTQGNFRTETFYIDINSDENKEHIISFKYGINILAVWLNINSENIGDLFNAYYKISYTGSITSDINTPTTTIPIDSTTINILNIGFIISLQRISDSYEEELGEILSIDKINNNVIVTNPTISNFVSGDTIKIKVNGMKNMKLRIPGRHSIGTTKIGASYITKNEEILVTYKNNQSVSKSFSLDIEYLY